VVAGAVYHALTASRPRIRYRVGKDAKLIGALPRVLPDWLLDEVRFHALGLPSGFGAAEKSASSADGSSRRRSKSGQSLRQHPDVAG
jgi:hypothetical protein